MVSNIRTGAQTVDHALEALSLIVTEGRLMSLDDITARLPTSKSATYRLLRSLEAAGYIARDPDAGGYGVINLTLFSQNLIKNVEFSASVYNLLNHLYADPASDFHIQDIIEQDGRTFRIKLTYRF